MKNATLIKPCIFATLAMLSQLAFATPAGSVTFKSGDATITHADKTVVPADKSAALNEGDTVETKNGRVQLAFIDGGKVSLQPNTIYKINKFAFSGKEDGTEYNFTELVKGGLRTISGLIGHKNRDHYQVKTVVATIGIRGTEYTASFDNVLTMTTNHGSVDVCSVDGGCLNAISGQTIVVAAGSAPKFSSKQAAISASPPASGKAVFAAADTVKVPSPLANFNGTGFLSTVMKTSCGCGFDGVKEANIKTDASARPTEITFKDGSNDITIQPLAFSSYNDDGVLAIGRATGGSKITSPPNGTTGPSTEESFDWMDYAIGEKPAVGRLSSLTGTASFTAYTSTAPMLQNGSTHTEIGVVDAVTGRVDLNFDNNSLVYDLTVPTSIETYVLGGGAIINSDGTFVSSSYQGNVVSLGTNSSCSVTGCSAALNNGNTLAQGAIIGVNADHVGLTYAFNVPGSTVITNSGPGNNNIVNTPSGQVFGTVGFK